ncbi:MAG: hypothetical protein GF365_02430 [Candidatus Buchananbacteria bacterium]|nr:hypothetical protein [Candidatus Buchananbacteria bacterium]
MVKIIDSLECSLQIWENLCLLIQLFSKFQQKQGLKPDYPLQGPFVHYAEFRNYLKSVGVNPDFETVIKKFTEPYREDKSPALGDLAQLAFELALWSSSSRRVYHLTSNMQLLLNATTTKNITWQDVRLPLPSFTILLDEPIKDTDGLAEYDCILVTSGLSSTGIKEIEFRLIPNDFRHYSKIADEEIKLMKKFLKQNKKDKLLKRIQKHYSSIPDPLLSPIFSIPLTEKALQSKVTDSIIDLALEFVTQSQAHGHKITIPKGVKVMPEEGNTATRLIVSLCLYLTTREGSKIKSKKHQTSKSKKNKSLPTISDCFEIFTINTERKLNPQEKNAFSEGLKRMDGQICPHWRMGTWRFPPNKANDPEAKKTVWVSPSLVNKHLITENTRPNGSKIHL